MKEKSFYCVRVAISGCSARAFIEICDARISLFSKSELELIISQEQSPKY
jgi:hypothetical protein